MAIGGPERNMVVIHGNLEALPLTNCALGHQQEGIFLWEKDGFSYLQCPECGLVWVNPQLTDSAVSQIYADGFKEKLGSSPQSISQFTYRRPLAILSRYNRTGRLLDIGCFTGKFLVAARQAGWPQVEGTEISKQAIDFAAEYYGLTIHHGDLISLDLPEKTYDAITLFDVIEHVSDPVLTLDRVHRLLRPGGVIYLETPHFNSIPRLLFKEDWSVFFPWHRTYFTVHNMRLALENAGFVVKQAVAVGILPFSRFSAWQAYISPQENIQQNRSKRIARLRPFLRPLWIGAKRAHELPFEALSFLGIHIGAKLIAYAEKAE